MRSGGPLFRLIPLFLLLCWISAEVSNAQPRLILKQESGGSYRVGERIDPATYLLDSGGEQVYLVDLLDPSARVVLLMIFGGPLQEPPGERFRGPLWCKDSFDDLAVQRALIHEFEGKPVQVLGIAVPPVYDPELYGYSDDLFFDSEESSEEYRSWFRKFVRKTLELQKSTLLPYPAIYFDPRFRLGRKRGEIEADSAEGKVEPWQGRFKWDEDPRKYGIPMLWILDGGGTVIHEPFWGNEYGSTPPQVRYGFKEPAAAVDALLNEGSE